MSDLNSKLHPHHLLTRPLDTYERLFICSLQGRVSLAALGLRPCLVASRTDCPTNGKCMVVEPQRNAEMQVLEAMRLEEEGEAEGKL